MSVVKFVVPGTLSTGFYTMSCVKFLSTMMMTFLSHPEASAWPILLLFLLFLAVCLVSVNAPSLSARFGVDWRLVTC
jgi:hypothetical protein